MARRRRKLVFGFSKAVDSSKPRSWLNLGHEHLTTMNAGQLVPVYLQEVLPGDTFKIDVRALVRQSTLLVPTMGHAYADITFFYVP